MFHARKIDKCTSEESGVAKLKKVLRKFDVEITPHLDEYTAFDISTVKDIVCIKEVTMKCDGHKSWSWWIQTPQNKLHQESKNYKILQ